MPKSEKDMKKFQEELQALLEKYGVDLVARASIAVVERKPASPIITP